MFEVLFSVLCNSLFRRGAVPLFACVVLSWGGIPRCEAAEDYPVVEREFRAAWVATVANIDWPSKPGLSTAEQKQELIAILDRAQKLKLNAIVFQVRPHCDAMYDSPLEPWSEYLTGTMGQPPEPYYDPLEFAVDEAHRRGLELHAWFNPYRALHSGSNSEVSAKHVSKAKPEIVRQYGKQLWLDPGEPEAAALSMAVIMDVVERYDIDGVHFDDYFYPYPVNDEQDKPVPFPDDASWSKVQAAGETLDRDDWRRQNVDRLIHGLSLKIHQAKPWVKFGISPFGIWRPGHPPQVSGFDAYDKLYADAKQWLSEGWVDYFSPQLYWKIDSPKQCYPVLMHWWHEQNVKGRQLWPGIYSSRVGIANLGDWPVEEITSQIAHTRAHPGASGNIHFSMKALQDDKRGLAEGLEKEAYARPAVVPAMPWLGSSKPPRPNLHWGLSSQRPEIEFSLPDSEPPKQWIVRTLADENWKVTLLPGGADRIALDMQTARDLTKIGVSAVSRTGIEGPIAELVVERETPPTPAAD